ncbi:hypothetical protein [Pseudomonas nitroreducens]|uniref:hypothetical protein n=1 Tax=Pseudomonas nitroreducens TaxID=46680 RepID=UPI0026586CCB|nr:hypothetical protein [Pseudomonas nitroreducens]MCP1652752.1 hypothetical protein [Pseudomonas nitroreducens]
MKKMLPELIGTAGVCLLGCGLWLQFGPGWACMGGGGLLIAGALVALRKGGGG